ncbi:MAG: hypothetical protein JWR39_1944 [Devosia sp.]|jgi:hypothetical protein|nr:hypothetical protein [Devosia sp.]
MRSRTLIIGWTLDGQDRAALLQRFVPVYPDVIAHHVTLQFNAPPNAPLPQAHRGEIIGHLDDGRGLQALVLSIAGSSHRPTGGTYHITWSLDRRAGRKPADSNQAIAERGWVAVAPIPVRLVPARL